MSHQAASCGLPVSKSSNDRARESLFARHHKAVQDRQRQIAQEERRISIEEKGSKKAAHFTPARCASFLQCLDQIDDQLRKLSDGEDLAYCMHYVVDQKVSLR